MRFPLGTVALLQYVCYLARPVLGSIQRDKSSTRSRSSWDKTEESNSGPMLSYDLSSFPESGSANSSEYFGQWLRNSVARISERQWRGLVTAKRISFNSSWPRNPRRANFRRDSNERFGRRAAKSSRGLTRKAETKRKRTEEAYLAARKYRVNASEYRVNSTSAAEDSLDAPSRNVVKPPARVRGGMNFSEYEERGTNLSVVLSSEAAVTDYDYGFYIKGLRANGADDSGVANNGSVSSGYPANDVTSRESDYRWGFLSLFLLVLTGGLGNILVCLSICLERRLQNVTNYFLLSLAVADLLVCVAVMPFSIGDAFYGHWPFGWHLCSFWVSCDVLSCSSSILHMCVVSVGRYMGIRNPLKTRSRASGKRTALVKIAFVWLASCAIASPIAVLALIDPTNIQPRDDLCAINNRFFFVFGSLFAFYAPMVVMVTSYALTVHLLRKKAQFYQMENVCSAATLVGGETGKVSLTPFEADTCLGCGERANGAGARPKMPTWKILLKKKKRSRSDSSKRASDEPTIGTELVYRDSNQELKVEAALISPGSEVVGDKYSRRNCNAGGVELEETPFVCQYCGSSRMSRGGSAKEKQKLPSTFLQRSRKRSSERSSTSTPSYESAIASTSRTNSILRKISTSSKQENGKSACRKGSSRAKGVGPTMFRVLGSTTRAQVHNEQKATKVLGLVFFAFVVCWSPFFVLNILFAVSGPDSLPEYLATTFLWLGYVSSTINPLIYTAFNRTFRRAFLKLLTCGKCGSGGSGFASTYVGSRVDRGFRGTTSSSMNVKRRVEWTSERRADAKLGTEPTSKDTEVTENSRYVYRGGDSEKNKRRKKARTEKQQAGKASQCPGAVSLDLGTCECSARDFHSEGSETGSQCRSEPNSSVRVKGGGGKRYLVKSLSSSCAEEIQRAAEEDRIRVRRSIRSETETRVQLPVEELGSLKGRKQLAGRRRQQLRLTSQREKKSDRNQTFC